MGRKPPPSRIGASRRVPVVVVDEDPVQEDGHAGVHRRGEVAREVHLELERVQVEVVGAVARLQQVAIASDTALIAWWVAITQKAACDGS